MTKKELKKILANIDEDSRAIAQGIIDELIFLQDVLKKLKQAIEEQGVVSSYANGAPRESPTLRSYNATIQRYGNLCKQLELMIHRDNKIETGENALKEWLDAQK